MRYTMGISHLFFYSFFMFDRRTMLLKRQWKFVVLVGIIAGLLSAALTMLFPQEYRADAQVLVISKTRYGVDPYTVVKSAERVGENLVAVMRTTDFFDKTMAQSNFAVDKTPFVDVSERIKRKRWIKSVEASVLYGTGVLNISAYHTDGDKAKELSGAVASALIAHGWEYVGGDITLKLVNPPVVSRFPVRPNTLTNGLMGLFVGMIIMSLAIVWRRS